jgi:hypothetical protein
MTDRKAVIEVARAEAISAIMKIAPFVGNDEDANEALTAIHELVGIVAPHTKETANV